MEEVTGSQIFGSEEPNVVEVSLAEFDALVETKKSLDRLLANEDYQKIVVNGYMGDEANRLADWIRNPKGNHEGYRNREQIVEGLAAIGRFERFISDMKARLSGIDNPEERAALVAELNELEAES